MSDPERLVWRGMPGHFIGASGCCFHLSTDVDRRYRVSTVGCYHHDGTDRAYETRQRIGLNRLYETMVFHLDDDGDVDDFSEIDFDGYNDEQEAELGHGRMIAKWLKESR